MKMRPRFPTIRRRHERGIMLVDCLVYIAIWMVVTGLAFSAFYRSLNYTRQLNRYTDDIALTMQVGERWREDIRRATAPLQMVGVESSIAQALHIPQKTNEVIYLFIDGMVLRQAQTNAVWAKQLPAVKSSRMQKDSRERVAAWRWEIELKARQKTARILPLFTFEAAAPLDSQPRNNPQLGMR